MHASARVKEIEFYFRSKCKTEINIERISNPGVRGKFCCQESSSRLEKSSSPRHAAVYSNRMKMKSQMSKQEFAGLVLSTQLEVFELYLFYCFYQVSGNITTICSFKFQNSLSLL